MMVAAVGETPSLTQKFIEKWSRDKQVSCIVPSLAPTPQTVPQCSKVCPAWVNTEGPDPLQLIRGPKQRNRAKMKEQRKTSERELSEEDIANLSDGEFKAWLIKMLTDLIELGRKMKKQMKDT